MSEHFGGARPGRPTAIAPAWHTVVLVAILVAFTFRNGPLNRFVHRHHWDGLTVLYGSTIVYLWLLVGFVALGVRRRGVTLRSLVGGRLTVLGILLDVLIAIGFLVVANIWLAITALALKADQSRGVLAVVPHGRQEIILFLALSLSAGVCEEIVFRGYLQRQFAALGRSALIGLLLQAALFGFVHAYQGPKHMLLVAVYGVFLGFLALGLRRLRANIIAHVLHDAVMGLLLSRFGPRG